jgi:cytidine deaminase
MEKLSEDLLQEMRQAARRASEHAYCPYSRFPVGAAALTGDGTISQGCNVENASFGLTVCAERNAIFQAISTGATELRAVVVYTPTNKPTAPCGACRQVINEFGPRAEVICLCDGPETIRLDISELLPKPFGPNNL